MKAEEVAEYCVELDRHNDPVMSDCSEFVRKVATRLGIRLPKVSADTMVNSFANLPFAKRTNDPTQAIEWANDGFVLAGMTVDQLSPRYGLKYHSGHLAVVHPRSDARHPGFPLASWGTFGGRGRQRSIRWSFPAAACDDRAVHFAFVPVGALPLRF
jgi:hypothetical protein